MPQDSSTGKLLRQARSLIGWLPIEQANLVQMENVAGVPIPQSVTERSARAHETVANRAADIDQENLLSEPPVSLEDYISTLQQNAAAAPYFAQGCSVQLADLRRICAAQPNVFIEQADERVGDIRPDDLLSIIKISLPLPSGQNLPAQFDHVQKAWVLSATNPNLRIMGNWAGSPPNAPPGAVGFGFFVSILPSFLQVSRVRGRYILRDGYHRAIGFLRRGINIVPVLYRELAQFEGLGFPAGMLPEEAYLGQRPPTLCDYLDESVSVQTALPATQKVVIIQGLEVSSLNQGAN